MDGLPLVDVGDVEFDLRPFEHSDLVLTMDLIDSGEARKRSVSSVSDALVAYIRTIGLQKGDRQTLTVRDPAGELVSEHRTPALESDKAQYLISTGRKRKGAVWAQGSYTATYNVTHDESEVLRKTFEIRIAPK